MTRLLVCLSLSAVALWGGYCVWFYVGDNHRVALRHLEVSAANWQILQGEGSVDKSGLTIAGPGRMGEAFAVGRLQTAFPAQSLHSLEVSFSQVGSYQLLSLGVSVSSNASGVQEALVGRFDGYTVQVSRDDLIPGRGDVQFVSIRIRGGLEPDFILEHARLYRSMPGFLELQSLIFESIVATPGWTQRSINHAEPAYTPLDLSPVVALALWIGMSVLAFWGSSKFGARSTGLRGLFTTFAVALVVGWVMLDVSWQWTLWSRHVAAVRQYSGLSSVEKRLTENDGRSFALVQELKETFPDAGTRVVIFAGSEYAQFRTRYFSLPLASISHRGINDKWLRRLRSGDIFVLVDVRDPLVKKPIAMDDDGQRSARDFSLHRIVGRSGRLEGCERASSDIESSCPETLVSLEEGLGPWLLDSPWLTDLQSGIWQVELVLEGEGAPGWARVELFRRAAGNSQRWAWRGVYVHAGQERVLKLPFQVTDVGHFMFRLADIDRVGLKVTDAAIRPLEADGGQVKLSIGEGPPYFIARKLVQNEAGSAWQLY